MQQFDYLSNAPVRIPGCIGGSPTLFYFTAHQQSIMIRIQIPTRSLINFLQVTSIDINMAFVMYHNEARITAYIKGLDMMIEAHFH